MTASVRRDGIKWCQRSLIMKKNLLMLLASCFLASSALAEDAWTTSAVDGARWLDSEAVSVSIEEGTKVTVIYREGDQARVLHGLDFGWVPANTLASSDPAALPEAFPLSLGAGSILDGGFPASR